MELLIRYLLDPGFVVMVLAGVAAFAAVATVTMPLLSGNRLGQRMKYVSSERERLRAEQMVSIEQSRLRREPKSFMKQVVEQLNLRKAFETEGVRNKLKMAGLRGQAPIVAFLFFRVAAPIAMFVFALIYLNFVNDYGLPPMLRLVASIGAAYVGFYLPNLFLSNLIQRRQTSIKRAFPDALDLLLICVQAGMSTEAAFHKVSKELTSRSIELAEEFSLTTAELSDLQERRQAYENLGMRTGLPGVKAVGMSLIQAERYGTPIGTALRVMAKENRDMRMSEAERKAAALAPKLTVPMIVFFLPVLFVVIMGPAVIRGMGLQ